MDGAKETIIRSADEALALLARGEAHRHVGRTNMNEVSSRSHSILRVVIESVDVDKSGDDGDDNSDDSLNDSAGDDDGGGGGGTSSGKVEEEGGVKGSSTFPSGEKVCFSVINLLDLAGSERVQRTGATGTRKLEGISINRSLLTLSTVGAAIVVLT